MKVLVLGATGMVGQGVLRECLLAPDVNLVQAVGRNATGIHDPRLRDVIHHDVWNYAVIESELHGFDACFYCLGVTSAGIDPAAYERITYDATMASAELLARVNPAMVFVYVSGAGTDSTEAGRIRWARVKGRTENALLRLPFRAYMFRPGIIQPVHGVRSKTALYRLFYTLGSPLMPLLRRLFPKQIVTTEQIGSAMLAVARTGAPKRVLESRDIAELA